MSDLNQYTQNSADWRKTLRQNNQRTYIVIALFFLIYASVGVLIDMYLASATYPQASLEQLFLILIHLQIFPIATLIMLAIAAVSLFVSYLLHDQLMLLGTEYHLVDPQNPLNAEEKKLYNIVEEMKVAAGLNYMPKVYIIEADYMNAFASGYSEKSAMVAITRGLMQKLNRDELQAVMAHEISHIKHLDIKLTLTASLLANLSIMALDMIFYGLVFGNNRNNEKSRNSLAGIIMLLRYLLPIINIIMLLYLSRSRELMADAGCVQLTRQNQPLANALLKISGDYQQNQQTYARQTQAHENVRREAYIFDPSQAGFAGMASINDLFSTHPSLETRLAALGFRKQS